MALNVILWREFKLDSRSDQNPNLDLQNVSPDRWILKKMNLGRNKCEKNKQTKNRKIKITKHPNHHKLKNKSEDCVVIEIITARKLIY